MLKKGWILKFLKFNWVISYFNLIDKIIVWVIFFKWLILFNVSNFIHNIIFKYKLLYENKYTCVTISFNLMSLWKLIVLFVSDIIRRHLRVNWAISKVYKTMSHKWREYLRSHMYRMSSLHIALHIHYFNQRLNKTTT